MRPKYNELEANIIQEEVENKTLMVNSAKFTGHTMQKAIDRYMAHRRSVKNGQSRAGPVVHKGRQTVKQLTRQGQELTNVELTDPDMKQFDRIARKYKVDYAVQKDASETPPKYMIFFKARDAGAITAVFREYTNKKVKEASRSSVLDALHSVPVAGKETDRGNRGEREL